MALCYDNVKYNTYILCRQSIACFCGSKGESHKMTSESGTSRKLSSLESTSVLSVLLHRIRNRIDAKDCSMFEFSLWLPDFIHLYILWFASCVSRRKA